MHRWWDDESTAVPVLDLVDGANPQVGVGVAVLGFHGIAKAALAPLASATLVDRAQLEAAYDGADFAPVAEAVHSALCEGMGHDVAARYADLVVADLVDKAKDATGRLTTVLVTKGIPWPRAVARAAEVAGVPVTRLGRYAATMMAPAVDPLSVADHADRTLFEYAAYRSAMEQVPVAKVDRERERARHRKNEPWDESEVQRDDRGRFAEEAKTSEDERAARAERKARREKKANRRLKRVREVSQTREVSRETPARERPRERSAERPRETPRQRSRQTGRERERADGSTGLGGFPLVSEYNVPNLEEGAVVAVNAQLHLIRNPLTQQWFPVAFTDREITDAVSFFTLHLTHDQVAEMKDRKLPIEVHRFEPGNMLVFGRTEGERGIPVPGYLFLEPGRHQSVTDDIVIVEGEPEPEEGKSYDQSSIGFLRVRYRDSAMEEVRKERERERPNLKVRTPWDESEVVRDDRGRFAEEARATDQEREARALRKKARERRARKRERAVARVQEAVVAQSVEREEPARERGLTRTGRVREREPGRAREAAVPRERGREAEYVREFFRPVGSGGAFTVVPAKVLVDIGFTDDIYYNGQGFLEREDAPTEYSGAWQNMMRHLEDQFAEEPERLQGDLDLARDRYGLLEADVETVAVDRLHMALNVLMSGSASTTPRQGAIDTAFALMAANADTVDSRAEPVDDAEYAERMVYAQGALHPAWTAPVMLDHTGTQQVLYTSRDTADPEPQAVAVISDEARQLITDLWKFTLPHYKENRHSREQARTRLLSLVNDSIVPNELDPRITDFQLLEAAMVHSGLRVDAMDNEAKRAVVAEALSQSDRAAVRLDGIDIIRIY